MIEGGDTSSLVLEKMQEGKNRDKIFRLVWVQNFDTSDRQFWVLFKHIEPNGHYLTTKIAPEHLFEHAPGAFYINGQRLQNPTEEGKLIRISVKTLATNSIKTVGEAFSDDLYDLRHNKVKCSKSQYCVVLDDAKHEVIFPCFALGAAYYFTSASMCRQLFAQSLKGLYKRESLCVNPKDRYAKIYLKTNAADGDVADIIRFATNKNAKKQWLSIVNRLRNSLRRQNQQNSNNKKDTNVPLIAAFPIAAEFTLKVRTVDRFYPELGKKKILVLEIMEENSPFDFDKVTIERIDQAPRTVDVKKRVKARRTTNIVTVKPPTDELASADIINAAPPKNVNKDNMQIEKKYVEGSERADVFVPLVDSIKGDADLSLLESGADGDTGVRHGEIKPPGSQKPVIFHKESFSLDNFQDLVRPLADENDVENFQMIGPLAMPRRMGSNAKGSLWEFSDKEHKIRRKYLRVTFHYKSMSICLIEISQNGLPSPTSTYVLTSSAGIKILQEHIQRLLNMFVERSTIESISNFIEGQEYTFLRKKHPAEKDAEIYKAWRSTLLRRIEGVFLQAN